MKKLFRKLYIPILIYKTFFHSMILIYYTKLMIFIDKCRNRK